MKKPQLILNIVFGLGLIALFVLFFTCRTSKPATQQEARIVGEGGPTGDGSIVYIQLDSLVNAYDMFFDLRVELENKAKVADDDLNNKGKAFERKAIDFQEKVQKGLLTRSQAEQLQGQLEQEQAGLQQYANTVRQDMAEEESVALRKVYDAIMTYLTEYNLEHNHSLILSTNGSTNVVMQGASGLDITKEILTELNARYTNEKKAKK